MRSQPGPSPCFRSGRAGVRGNVEKIDCQDLDVPFDPPVLIQVGKRSFVEIVRELDKLERRGRRAPGRMQLRGELNPHPSSCQGL